MKNLTGQLARGSDFFDRRREMERFWLDLDTDNLLLLAARRVGKTSLMYRMADDAVGFGFSTVFVDVCDCADELRFVQRLFNAILATKHGETLWPKIKKSGLAKTVRRVQKIGGAGFSVELTPEGSAPWTRFGEELAETLSHLEGRWLIQIDELPVFVLNLLNATASPDRVRVREFLYWMRRLRLQYPSIRWMLAGSIGLDTVASRLNIGDAVNDLHIAKLDAFEEAAADEFLRLLSEAYRLELTEPVRQHVIRRAGWPVPFYLQLIFKELRSVSKPVTEEHVDRAIESLLGPQHRNYFDYWRQRLHEELGEPDGAHASLILSHCSRAPEGASRSTLSLALSTAIRDAKAREDALRYLLDVLQNDGYLVEAHGKMRFRSPLLREFWLRRVAPPEESDSSAGAIG